MAVKYLRLFDPTQQFQLKGGQLNVAGRLFVHLEATDDLAALYDENGVQLTQPVILDNNGRAAGIFVDAAKVYWLDVQDQYGMSQFTVRKMTPCGGGGGSVIGNSYDVVSSDGSIVVDKFDDAGVTTFDLSIPEDGSDLLEYIRCDGSAQVQDSDIFRPIFTDGTMTIGEKGIELLSGRYYHVTAHVKVTKDSTRDPFYDNVSINFSVDDGTGETTITTKAEVVDYSLGLSQEFEVSTDVKAESDCELVISITGQDVQHGTFELVDVEVHRIFSGAPEIPSGVVSRIQVQEMINNHGKGVHRLLRYYTNSGDADADHPAGDWLHDFDAVDESDPSGHPMVTADQLFDWYEDGQIFDLYETDGRDGQIGWSAVYRMVTWQDQSEWWSQFAPVPGKACRLEFFRMGMYSTPYRGGLIAYIRYKDEDYMRLYEIKSGNSIWMAEYQEKLPYYSYNWHNGDLLRVKEDGTGLEWVTVHEPVIGTVDL